MVKLRLTKLAVAALGISALALGAAEAGMATPAIAGSVAADSGTHMIRIADIAPRPPGQGEAYVVRRPAVVRPYRAYRGGLHVAPYYYGAVLAAPCERRYWPFLGDRELTNARWCNEQYLPIR